MLRVLLRCLLIYSSILTATSAYNILAVLPLPSRSHYTTVDNLLVALAEKGHHVTVYSPFPKSRVIPRYREINIGSCFSFSSSISPIEEMLKLGRFPLLNLLTLFKYIPDFSNFHNCSELVHLMNTEEKYDLFFIESFAYDGMLMLAHKFQVPFITYTPNVLFPWLSDRMGEPDNPAYVQHFFLGSKPMMNFVERVHNVILYVASVWINDYWASEVTDKLYRTELGSDTLLSKDIVRNTSLMFMYTIQGSSPPLPHVPNVIDVGGMHIKEPYPLPEVSIYIGDQVRESNW